LYILSKRNCNRKISTAAFHIFQKNKQSQLHIDTLGNVTSTSTSSSSSNTFISSTPNTSSHGLISYLLPSGFPKTVAPSYTKYALYSFLASTASSAGSVLAMQSLLIAVGVGSNVAVPAAAALNWVLKDGLGQAGGVAFAALIGNRFDADPKRWRLVSALVLDTATVLEVCSPLFGLQFFLPVASFANFLKNVAWLTASATRAGIHQALAIRGNLADLTAKAASQSIAASTLGTAIGIAISTILSATIGSDPINVLAVFSVASLLHLTGVVFSLRSVVIPTLSAARMDLALDDWVNATSCVTVDTTTTTLRKTNITTKDMENTHKEKNKEIKESNTCVVKTPAEVALVETFFPWELESVSSFSVGCSIMSYSNSNQHSKSIIQVSTGDLLMMQNLRSCIEQCSTGGHEIARYVVGLKSMSVNSLDHSKKNRREDNIVQLHFSETADWNDILTGYIHAMKIRAELNTLQLQTEVSSQNLGDSIIKRTRMWTLDNAPMIIRILDEKGWWVGTPLIDVSPELRIIITKC
jgi:hypothetical protein